MTVVLGNTYKDRVTGFTGVATGRSVFLTGQPRVSMESVQDGRFQCNYFDEERLEEVVSAMAPQASAPLPAADLPQDPPASGY